MPELRWTLLVIGAIFIAVLAWWERRKRGQAPRSSDEQTLAEPLPKVVREPLLTLPDIRVHDRERPAPEVLPVVEIADDESLMGLRIDGEPAEAGVADEDARAGSRAADDELGAPGRGRIVARPVFVDLPVARQAPEQPAPHDAPPVIDAADTEPPSGGSDGPRSGSYSSDSAAGDFDLPKLPKPEEPLVEWPPEQERRILALRVVCMGTDRFPGRAVRTALVAEGFMLGKYSIFHKPDGERRAVLSAASLSKPGVFDPDTIDSQRFGGLSLFAVLPGPLPAREAFEGLLSTARSLNERLQGGLQDERGSPLTPTRIAALREGLGSIAAAQAGPTAGSATMQ